MTTQEFAARLRRSTGFIVGGPSDLIISEMEATPDDRASIVAFLTAEAVRFEGEARRAFVEQGPFSPAAYRLPAQAGLLRTLAAQVSRGDDRLGQTPTTEPAS